MCCISAETVCFVMVSVIMVSAAYQDVRSREVSDLHWLSMSVVAVVMCPLRLDGVVHVILGVVAVSMMSSYMLSDRISGIRAVSVLLLPTIIHLVLFMDGEGPWTLVVSVMYFLFLSLYYTGLLRGGADAKAMMSISMVSPFYLWSGVLWSSGPIDGILLNPPMAILIVALILSLAWAIPTLIRSMSSGCLSVSHHRMSIDEAEASFVWPTEDVVDGEVRSIRPSDDPMVYGRLREYGRNDVEVTPMIPFVLPITVSYVMVMIIGNPLTMLIR